MNQFFSSKNGKKLSTTANFGGRVILTALQKANFLTFMNLWIWLELTIKVHFSNSLQRRFWPKQCLNYKERYTLVSGNWWKTKRRIWKFNFLFISSILTCRSNLQMYLFLYFEKVQIMTAEAALKIVFRENLVLQ